MLYFLWLLSIPFGWDSLPHPPNLQQCYYIIGLDIPQTYDYNATDPNNPIPSPDPAVDFSTLPPGGPYTLAPPANRYAVQLSGFAYLFCWFPFPIWIPAPWRLRVAGSGPFSNGSFSFPLSSLEWKTDASALWTPMTTTYQPVDSSVGLDYTLIDYRLTIPYSAAPGNGYSTTIRYSLVLALNPPSPPLPWTPMAELTRWQQLFGPLPDGTHPYIRLVTDAYHLFPGVPFPIPFTIQNPMPFDYEIRVRLEFPIPLQIETVPTGWEITERTPTTSVFQGHISGMATDDFAPVFRLEPQGLRQTTYSFTWYTETRASPNEPWSLVASGRGRFYLQTYPFSQRGRIIGIVQSQKKPVPNTKVTLSSGLEVSTDSLGRFSFVSLPPGYYGIWISDGPTVVRKVVHLRPGETRYVIFNKESSGEIRAQEFIVSNIGVGSENQKVFLSTYIAGHVKDIDFRLSLDTRNPSYFRDPDEIYPLALYPEIGSPTATPTDVFHVSIQAPALQIEGGRLPLNSGFPLLSTDMEGFRYRIGSKIFMEGQIGLPKRNVAIERYRSNGTVGPYYLERTPIRPLTEKVFLEYRSPSGTVVELHPLPVSEYSLDYDQGVLLFHEPIPERQGGLEVWIVIVYESRGTSFDETPKQLIQQHEVGWRTKSWTLAGGWFLFPSTQQSFYTTRFQYHGSGMTSSLRGGWKGGSLGFLHWGASLHRPSWPYDIEINYRFRDDIWRILPAAYYPSPYQWAGELAWRFHNAEAADSQRMSGAVQLRVTGTDGHRFYEGAIDGNFGPYRVTLQGILEPGALLIHRWTFAQKRKGSLLTLFFGLGSIQRTMAYGEAGMGVQFPIGRWDTEIRGQLSHEGPTPRADFQIQLSQDRRIRMYLVHQRKPSLRFTQLGSQWNFQSQRALFVGNFGATTSGGNTRGYGFLQGFAYLSPVWGIYGSIIAAGENRLGIFYRPGSPSSIQLLASYLWSHHTRGGSFSLAFSPYKNWNVNAEYRARGKSQRFQFFTDWALVQNFGMTLGWDQEPKWGVFWENSGIGIRWTYGLSEKWKLSTFISLFQSSSWTWKLPEDLKMTPSTSSLQEGDTLQIRIEGETSDGSPYEGPVQIFVDTLKIAEVWLSSSDTSGQIVRYVPSKTLKPGVYRLRAYINQTEVASTWFVLHPPDYEWVYHSPPKMPQIPAGPPKLGDLDLQVLAMKAETVWVQLTILDQWGRTFREYQGEVQVYTSNHVSVTPSKIVFQPEDRGSKQVRLVLRGMAPSQSLRLIFRATYAGRQVRYAFSEPISMRP